MIRCALAFMTLATHQLQMCDCCSLHYLPSALSTNTRAPWTPFNIHQQRAQEEVHHERETVVPKTEKRDGISVHVLKMDDPDLWILGDVLHNDYTFKIWIQSIKEEPSYTLDQENAITQRAWRIHKIPIRISRQFNYYDRNQISQIINSFNTDMRDCPQLTNTTREKGREKYSRKYFIHVKESHDEKVCASMIGKQDTDAKVLFKKLPPNYEDDFCLPYDIRSITHARTYDYSKNERTPTVEAVSENGKMMMIGPSYSAKNSGGRAALTLFDKLKAKMICNCIPRRYKGQDCPEMRRNNNTPIPSKKKSS